MTLAVSPAGPNTALPLAEYVNTEQVLAAIPSILIGIDMATKITWWNTTAEQTFGLAASQVVGRPLQECGIPVGYAGHPEWFGHLPQHASPDTGG